MKGSRVAKEVKGGDDEDSKVSIRGWAAKATGVGIDESKEAMWTRKKRSIKGSSAVSCVVESKVPNVSTAARWKSWTENPGISRLWMTTVTAIVERLTKKIESFCLSGPVGRIEEHEFEGENTREDPHNSGKLTCGSGGRPGRRRFLKGSFYEEEIKIWEVFILCTLTTNRLMSHFKSWLMR